MLLRPLPTKSAIRWQTVDIDGQTLRVAIQPPSYEQLVRARTELSTAKAVLIRLEAIVDWDDVYVPGPPDAAPSPLPFTPDALRDLLRDLPGALNALLKLVNPLFAALPETAGKNSEGRSDAGTADTPPSPSTVASGDSSDSAANSD